MKASDFGWLYWLGLTKKIVFQVNGNIITGYLWLPKHRNHRAIVYCHGGFGEVKSPTKVWARILRNWGYVVLALDFPGEGISPGKEKPNAYRDFQEVEDASAWLRKRCGLYWIDLVGDSRGGWVALMAFSLYRQLFDACYVSVAPTSLPEFFATTSIREPMLGMLREYFAGLSPINLAYRLAGPKTVGLLYGEKDRIVPPEQGELMRRGLKERGGQVKYFLSPGSGHGAIAYPENLRLMVSWILGKE